MKEPKEIQLISKKKYQKSAFLSSLLFLIIFISSCQKTKQLEGVWINVSDFIEGEEPDKVWAQHLYDFEEDSINIVQLGNHASVATLEINIEKGTYEEVEDQLIIYLAEDTLTFDYHLQDSLLLSYESKQMGYYLTTIFRRMDLQKTFTKQLSGSYELHWPGGFESINFVNDSIYFDESSYKAMKWKVFSYKGADILLFQDDLTPVASIWDQDQETTRLTFHNKPQRKVYLTKGDIRNRKEDLIGNWSRFQANKPLPPPPPPFPPFWKNNKFNMEIKKDTLVIDYYGNRRKLAWELTSDGKRIYFPDRIMDNDASWLIKHLSVDSLVLSSQWDDRVVWHRINL